jgi:hypothetical protein
MKQYGFEIIRHPNGWTYLIAYLSNRRCKNNSMLLLAWEDNGRIIEVNEHNARNEKTT